MSIAASPATPPQPWDGFLVGPENALAHASVLALARGEGPGLSPLVVCGPAGVGKSRLLTGLVAEWLARRPDSAVAHLTAEAFAAECAAAADRPEGTGWAELRARLRSVDLFVLEDLHALERVPFARRELGHTLDALDGAGAAVAVSARSAPSTWSGWPSRVVSRLLGGLTVRVGPPEIASRRRFVLERARAKGLTLAAETVESLAESAEGYRELDGLLARLEWEGRLARGPRDGHEAGESLRDQLGERSGAITAEAIARAVAARFGVRLSDLRSGSRRAGLVVPRHLAMHLIREATGQSFAAIGAYFGGRDPATVRYACRAAAERLAADPVLGAVAAELARRFARATG